MSSNQTNWLAIALTFVLAGVFFVLISGNSEATYAHSLSVKGENPQSGEPDETLTFTIEIDNTGSDNDDYTLGISTTEPTGWTFYLNRYSISVSDGNKGEVKLYVDIGNRTNALGGVTQNIEVWCQSAGEAANNETTTAISKVKKIHGTTLVTSVNSISVDPNNAATFSINITNDKGNYQDTVTFSQTSTGTDAWTFTLPGQTTLDVDETKSVSFSVTPDIEALAGLKSISFIATSTQDDDPSPAVSTLSITVRVNQLPALEVTKVGSTVLKILKLVRR